MHQFLSLSGDEQKAVWARVGELLAGIELDYNWELFLKAEDSLLWRGRGYVVKMHACEQARIELEQRFVTIESTERDSVFLQPILYHWESYDPGFILSVWQEGEVLQQGLDTLPWSEAGRLLARLHSIQLKGNEPTSRFLTKLKASKQKIKDWIVVAPSHFRFLEQSIEALFPLCFGQMSSQQILIHGDFHFGQLVRLRNTQSLKIIDIDDIGSGDPLWDLARTAAFFASGLLSVEDYSAFYSSYAQGMGWQEETWTDRWAKVDRLAQFFCFLCAAQGLMRAEREKRKLNLEEQAFYLTSRKLQVYLGYSSEGCYRPSEIF